MNEKELKQDITMYLHLHPDSDYTFEELFEIAQKLPVYQYELFIKEYGRIVEEILG